MDKSKIIINTESTAGYEALSSQIKLLFSILEEIEYLLILSILVGLILLKKGNILTNKNNYKELKRVMDYLNNVSYQKFITKSKTIREIVMKSDPGNKIVRSYIPKLINQKL